MGGAGGGGTGGTGGQVINPLIPAPPMGQGVQFNMPEVTVPPGGEVQVCLFFKLPSDTDFFFNHIQMEMSPGGRHLYVWKSEFFDFPDEFRTDCFAPVDTNTWAVVVQSQNEHVDWPIDAPGVAFRLRHKTQMMLMAHYYNTGTQPITDARATVNLWNVDPSTVQHWANSLVAVQNNINIPAGQSGSVNLHCTLPVDTVEQAYPIHPTHILALSGDFHHAGRDFSVDQFHLTSTTNCPPTCPGTVSNPPVFYDTHDGMSPLWQTFAFGTEPIIQNYYGFDFTCNYDNTMGTTALTFGPRVLSQEHCTLFMYFWPAPMDGLTLGCTEITGAW